MAASYDFSFVLVALRAIAKAVPTTLFLTIVPLFLGILIGVPCAVARRFRIRFLAAALKGAAGVLKGIPAVLLVLITNYLVLKPIDFLAMTHEWAKPLQTMDKIWIGLIAISVYAVVQITETVLSALLAVDGGQYEAAYSIGLTKRQTLFRIVFPQALPVALPMLGNNVIGLLKTTSIVYLISVTDILAAALNSANINFRYLEAYIAVAIVYWGLCLVVERLFLVIEYRFRRREERT